MLSILCGCQTTNNASSSTSNVGDYSSVDSSSSQQESTNDTTKADKLIEQALKEYTPVGIPATQEQLKIAQRGVDASMFADLVNSEGFIIDFAAKDGEIYPDLETYNKGEGFVEIAPFEQKIGEDIYKVTNFKSLENLLEDTLSGECKEYYMYYDDGSSYFDDFYKDINGKLFARYIGCGSMYYYPKPIIEKTIVKKAEKDYYLFSVPIARGYTNTNSSESNEYEVDGLNWYNYEMIKVDGVWKLNNDVSYDESVHIKVNKDGTATFKVWQNDITQ